MKPILEKIIYDMNQSIYLHKTEFPYFHIPLHYHPEIEIIHIIKSYGTKIVGNSVNNFEEGDLVMVGSNIPHVWKNDKEFYQGNSKLTAACLVIQFNNNCFGEQFFQLPEMIKIRRLLNQAKRGISFRGKSKGNIISQMFQVYNSFGQDRLIALIDLLHSMSSTREYDVLSTIDLTVSYSDEECEKVNKIYDYLFKNYVQDIDFNKIADMVNMSPPSLCRYFKKHTQKTITDILNEIRVRQACKLLSLNKANAKEACYISGFNNYSHYNKQFKKIVGKTPFHYQKQYNS